MAKSTTGKLVSRIGASGGGKSYKKSRPFNYYGVIAVIVVLGLASVAYSRYEYQNPASSATKGGVAPAIGTTWYAALGFDICGSPLFNLQPNTLSHEGFITESDNVIKLDPISAADSGNNATLSQFAVESAGMLISSSALEIPKTGGVVTAATTFKNGETCPSNSAYAGKTGHVEYAYWRTFGQTKPTITTNPASIKFSNYLRVTMAFVPTGVTPSAPSQATVTEMYKLSSTATTTTTTASTTTTTLATSATTTTTTKAG